MTNPYFKCLETIMYVFNCINSVFFFEIVLTELVSSTLLAQLAHNRNLIP